MISFAILFVLFIKQQQWEAHKKQSRRLMFRDFFCFMLWCAKLNEQIEYSELFCCVKLLLFGTMMEKRKISLEVKTLTTFSRFFVKAVIFYCRKYWDIRGKCCSDSLVSVTLKLLEILSNTTLHELEVSQDWLLCSFALSKHDSQYMHRWFIFTLVSCLTGRAHKSKMFIALK